jgi:hypothetical protein
MMSSPAVERPELERGRRDPMGTDSAPYRFPVFAAFSLLAVALNYFLGKEMAWDTLHYHLYAGFSALHDRFDQDYFAAGPQSYFNPYAYVPFYLLVKLGFPDLVIGTILAVLHSVVLWITYELACTVRPSEDRKQCLFFGLSVTTLALMNPILLRQIGSAFADITTAGLVLAGWLLLAKTVRRPCTKRVICSAILLGGATALKETNAVHALAGFLVLIFVPLPPLGRIRSLFLYGATLAASFVLVSAPWSYRLAKAFSNPMFPLLNGVFKSPEFTTVPVLKHYRFIPDSLGDALLRPFSIVTRTDMVHEELLSPDIRYALLLVVFLILVIARIWRPIARGSVPEKAPSSESSNRVLMALGCGFTIDWFIWLAGSGNGRYFIPMANVAGLLGVALLFRLLANHVAGRNVLVVTLLVAQVAQVYLAGEYRWNYAPWEGHWFNVKVPDALANEPNLYLSIGMQSSSYVVPFLAKGSSFINISGTYALGPDGANASRVRALIARNAPHLRVIVSGEKIYPDSARREPRVSDVDDILSSFGVRVDMNDCQTISVQGLRWKPLRALASSIPASLLPPAYRNRPQSYLASCRVVADSRGRSEENSTRRVMDMVLNRVEDACPALFQPRRPQTEHEDKVWFRVYPMTDLTAWIGDGEVKFVDPIRHQHEIVIGREEEWAKAPLSLSCGRKDGIYFARVAPAAGHSGARSP